MHVGFNLAYLRPTAVGGSEVYVRELLPRIARLPGNTATAFCWEAAAPTLAGAGARLVPVASGAFSQRGRLWAENVALARVLREHRVDVLFSPANFAAPLLPSAVPQVATLHDLQHVHLPAHFSRAQRLFRGALFRATAWRCRELIAISEFTRRDAIATYGIAPGRITTILEGVPDAPAPAPAAREAARARYGLPASYFYYPAMLAPHKNHVLLLDALLEARKSCGARLALVLSGARGDRFPELERAVRDRKLEGAVLHLGFIPREDVLPVMAGARALAFPSLFEGFGLPVIEAMQCDVPVIASAATSLPDVAGDAAILLDPRDAGAWARAMVDVLRDDVRLPLVARGRANVRRFSWDRCAAETNEVLRRAALA